MPDPAAASPESSAKRPPSSKPAPSSGSSSSSSSSSSSYREQDKRQPPSSKMPPSSSSVGGGAGRPTDKDRRTPSPPSPSSSSPSSSSSSYSTLDRLGQLKMRTVFRGGKQMVATAVRRLVVSGAPTATATAAANNKNDVGRTAVTGGDGAVGRQRLPVTSLSVDTNSGGMDCFPSFGQNMIPSAVHPQSVGIPPPAGHYPRTPPMPGAHADRPAGLPDSPDPRFLLMGSPADLPVPARLGNPQQPPNAHPLVGQHHPHPLPSNTSYPAAGMPPTHPYFGQLTDLTTVALLHHYRQQQQQMYLQAEAQHRALASGAAGSPFGKLDSAAAAGGGVLFPPHQDQHYDLSMDSTDSSDTTKDGGSLKSTGGMAAADFGDEQLRASRPVMGTGLNHHHNNNNNAVHSGLLEKGAFGKPTNASLAHPASATPVGMTNSKLVTSADGSLCEQPVSRTYQYRKVMKPLLERKRRARINRCLDELKELMVSALQAEGENVAKLEKADVLELTVTHLRRLAQARVIGGGGGGQPQHPLDARSPGSMGAGIEGAGDAGTPPSLSAPTNNDDVERFKAGFARCAAEVYSFLDKHCCLSQQERDEQEPSDAMAAASANGKPNSASSGTIFNTRLLGHLTQCIKNLQSLASNAYLYGAGNFKGSQHQPPPPIVPIGNPARPPAYPNSPAFPRTGAYECHQQEYPYPYAPMQPHHVPAGAQPSLLGPTFQMASWLHDHHNSQFPSANLPDSMEDDDDDEDDDREHEDKPLCLKTQAEVGEGATPSGEGAQRHGAADDEDSGSMWRPW